MSLWPVCRTKRLSRCVNFLNSGSQADK
jgi:hypothetical protein